MKEPQYSNKMWIHNDGRIVNIPYGHSPTAEDHTVYAAENPHLFDHTEEELTKAIGGPDQLRKAKKYATHPELHRHLESKGWSRVTNEFNKDMKIRTINFDRAYHRAHPDEYIKALEKLHPFIQERVNAGEEVLIGLHGINRNTLEPFLKSRGLTKREGQQMIAIGDMKTLNTILGKEGGKVSRAPQAEPPAPTSSQIRAAMPKEPQGNMTRAELNYYRTLGDSYNPIKSFKDLLFEIYEIKNKR
jgi:hypothetical protein